MKVRLKDIAKIANVSVASVSIVLNDPDTTRISEARKKEILAIADELNYVPNTAARSLVTNRSKIIGAIIPDLENQFFSSFAKSIEEHCRKHGYVVMMMNTHENVENDAQIIDFLHSRGVDGMIISLSGGSYTNNEAIINSLNKLTIPYVLADRTMDNFEANAVVFNNKQGEYLATKHLIDQGHTKIGYISTKKHSMTGHFRHLGYEKALRKAGIEINEDYISYGKFDYETGYQAGESLFKTDVTAIACANDLIAFGLIRRAREMGISVPEDISLVGFDNLYINDIMEKGLTSIDQNTNGMGQASVKILMDAINGNTRLKKVVLEPTLKIRQSVRKIND